MIDLRERRGVSHGRETDYQPVWQSYGKLSASRRRQLWNLGYARRMTWEGHAPAVDRLTGECRDGVRLTKTQMKPIEARLERSKTLPKYDITIRPLKASRG